MNDPFALLGLGRRFDIDLKEAEKKHRELSKALHPDRFVAPAERRVALEKSIQVNEAYRTLKDPVRRAEALFGLAGVPVGDGKEPMAPPSFLMEMMESREALADARAERDLQKIRALGAEMRERRASLEAELDGVVWGDVDVATTALPKLGELRFYVRYDEEVRASEDALEDTP